MGFFEWDLATEGDGGGVFALVVGNVGVGAVLDEEGDDRLVSVSGCENQGCHAFPVACVGVGALLEEVFDLVELASFAGFGQLFVKNSHKASSGNVGMLTSGKSHRVMDGFKG